MLFAIWLLNAPVVQAQAPLTVQQRAAVQDRNTEAEQPETQSLEQLLQPTVRRLVEEELARETVTQAPAPSAAANDGDPFANLIDSARNSVRDLSQNFKRGVDVAPRLPEHWSRAFILLTDLQGWPRMWEGIFNLALMLFGGWIVVSALGRLLNRILMIPETVPPFGLQRLAASAVDLIRNAVLLAAFIATGFLLSLVWFDQVDPMRIFLITYLGAVSVGYAGWIVARFLFAPTVPGHRMIDAGDAAMRSLSVWTTAVFAIIGLVGFSVGMIRLLGMPAATFDIMLLATGLLIATLTVIVILRTSGNPEAPAAGMLGSLFTRYRRAWLLILTGLFLLLWLVSVLSGDGTKIAAILIGSAAIGMALYLGHLWPMTPPAPEIYESAPSSAIPVDPEDPKPAETEALPPVEEEITEPARVTTGDGLFPSLRTIARALLGLAAALSVLHVLGLDMVAAFGSRVGQLVSLVLLDVAIILLVAGVCWALVERTINRFMRREHDKAMALAADAATDEDGLGGVITSRFGTLLPLIRGFVLSVLVSVTIMVVLSSMGIDIGPLLAGAGVVGIAIGFGAQALVRDIISGVFFLIDDAFRVGEYVEFGEIRGQVEQISIRSMRLRHHRGAIHTIPFGELRSITNYNRDWAIYKQEFRLHYEVDTDKVRKIIKKVGLRLLEDPELGPKFIQPLKSQGVFKIEEGALILRTKFMCKPREQFIIRKAVFQEVKNALYEQGIELAQRRVQIDWPEWMQGQELEGETPTSDAPRPQPPSPAAVAAAAGAAQIATENKTRPVYPDEP
ncbi:mechanosensitive ion channel family protein [Minwuia sp.]|uniref:mechanosensitive ion channel family protein n=1 Tax=Minwuia sp. TaxID=2493630 RepID=UPI003A9110FF